MKGITSILLTVVITLLLIGGGVLVNFPEKTLFMNETDPAVFAIHNNTAYWVENQQTLHFWYGDQRVIIFPKWLSENIPHANVAETEWHIRTGSW